MQNKKEERMNGLKFIRNKVVNMTMEEFSDTMNISRQILYLWESGKKEIPENRLKELEQFSGIPARYFKEQNLSDNQINEIMKYKIVKDMKKVQLPDESNKKFGDRNSEYFLNLDIDKKVLIEVENDLMRKELISLVSRIIKIIYATNEVENVPKNELVDMRERAKLFERFASIVEGTEEQRFLSQMLRVMELYLGTNDNLKSNHSISDESPLIQDILQVLNTYKQKEIELLEKEIEDLQKLVLKLKK